MLGGVGELRSSRLHFIQLTGVTTYHNDRCMTNVTPLPDREPSTKQKLLLLAAESANIILTIHGKARGRKRLISPVAVQKCLLRGVIVEEFINVHGHIQVTVERRAAGEEMTCVAAIDWPSKVIVITVY